MTQRRTLLKALLTASLTAGATMPSALAAPRSLRVLAVVPRESAATRAYLGGLRSGAFTLDVVTASSGHDAGVRLDAVLARGARPDVIVGLGFDTALERASARHGLPCLLSGAGARVEPIASPLTVRHSLELWSAQWALGDLAARRAERGVLLLGAREAGYDLHRAYEAAFTAPLPASAAAHLDTVLLVSASGALGREELLDRLLEAKPEHVHFLSSDPNDWQNTKWALARLPRRPELSSVAAAPRLETRTALASPDRSIERALHALGEEAALLLGRLRDGGLDGWLRGGADGGAVEGPRGVLRWEAAVRVWRAPIVFHGSSGVSHDDTAAPPLHHPARFALQDATPAGYSNAYLFA